jgi:hypothetical protein
MHGTPTSTSLRTRRGRVIVLAVICGALAIAGCGSSSKSTTTTAGSTPYAAALKFSACMRAHGVPNFPDPTSDGQSVTTGQAPTGSKVDKRSPAFHTAQQACKSLATEIAAAKPRNSRAVQLEQAECMRAHGVTSFPDPLPGGGFTIPSTISLQSPTYIAAEKACSKS